MSRKYYYGLPDQELYYSSDLESAIEDNIGLFIDDYFIIVELTTNRYNDRWCSYDNIGIDDCKWCNNYRPRNSKNGICKHQSWRLTETGRKWEVNAKTGEYKKISCRRKNEIYL